MRQKNKRILKEYLKRTFFLKKSLKDKIYKSIIHNNNGYNINKTYFYFKLQKKKKSSISFQHNVCFNTGRYRNVFRFNNLARHSFKKLNIEGRVQNIKNLSW